MRTVWKYTISVREAPVQLLVPAGATIVHVAPDGMAHVDFWADVNTDMPRDLRTFHVSGTGHEVPDSWVHLGTAVVPGQHLVWQLWEVPA